MRVNLPEIAYVYELSQATALLDPLRLRILEEAREPASAARIADRLELPRQRVNYHVKKLAAARLLIRAGRVRKRNMVEQRYLATSRAYVIDPALLGPLTADLARLHDEASVSRLIALASRAQHDLARVTAQAASEGTGVAALSIAADLPFASAQEGARFAEALRDAVAGVVGRSPARALPGEPARGTPSA